MLDGDEIIASRDLNTVFSSTRFTLVLKCQGTLRRHFLSEATECFIRAVDWLSKTPHLQHNYRTASLGSLTPFFISQQHSTIFTPQRWARDVRLCDINANHCSQSANATQPVWRIWLRDMSTGYDAYGTPQFLHSPLLGLYLVSSLCCCCMWSVHERNSLANVIKN